MPVRKTEFKDIIMTRPFWTKRFTKPLAALLGAFALLTLAACGGGGTGGTSPNTPTGSLGVSPGTVVMDFGSAPVTLTVSGGVKPYALPTAAGPHKAPADDFSRSTIRQRHQ